MLRIFGRDELETRRESSLFMEKRRSDLWPQGALGMGPLEIIRETHFSEVYRLFCISIKEPMTLKELLHGKTDSSAIQLVRSVAVSNVAFALDFVLCLAFVSFAKINYLVSRVMAAILVFFFNFACKKLLVFGALARLGLAHRTERR
jgi:hypothetical protein